MEIASSASSSPTMSRGRPDQFFRESPVCDYQQTSASITFLSGLFPSEVAVADRSHQILALKVFTQFPGQADRTVLAAGAADGDG